MIDRKQARATDDLEELEQVDAYVEWQKREGVPVIRDFVFEDLNALELGDWPRKSGRGAIINIPNPYLPNDAHVVEIRPGSQSAPERHMYEEMVLILSGRGSTSVWIDEKRKQTFEWGEGSLFSIPLNAWYQIFNGSGAEPIRYLSLTNLPPMLRLFQNSDFIFNNPFEFTDRFKGEQDYFTGEGKLYRGRKWRGGPPCSLPPTTRWRWPSTCVASSMTSRCGSARLRPDGSGRLGTPGLGAPRRIGTPTWRRSPPDHQGAVVMPRPVPARSAPRRVPR